MNFTFKIFGVPHIFDMYQGSENEISYFQSFYNGSKENTKITVHRMASGRVSYSYLRYNFISDSGRPNAFFGMSVIFNQEYCADVANLYKLFDGVYQTILQNKILFEEIKGNPVAQAKFLVRSFAEAENEVKRIENIVCKNIESQFAADIHPIDSSFLQSNTNVVVRLSNKKGNETFLKALREYSWVSISPEYKDNEQNILSFEAIGLLDARIKSMPPNIVSISINAMKGANVRQDIRAIWEQIQKEKEFVKPYLQLQPELQDRDKKLNDYQKQLKELNDAVPAKATAGTMSVTFATTAPEKTPGPPQPVKDDPKPSFWNRRKLQLIAVAAVPVIVVSGILFLTKDTKPTNTQETDTLSAQSVPKNDTTNFIKKGDDYLQQNEFDKAKSEYEKAGKTDLVENANNKAVQYWREQAADKKEPQEAIECLEKTKKYGGYANFYRDIADFRKQIDDAAKAEKKRQDEAKQREQEGSRKKQEEEEKKKNDCLFGGQKKTADQYLKDIEEQDIKKGRYQSAVECCNLIINSPCTTEDQKNKAKLLKRQANANL